MNGMNTGLAKQPTTQPQLVREKILAREKVYLGEGQFSEGIPNQLITLITDAGGEMTNDLESCTKILMNPASNSYKSESQRITSHLQTNFFRSKLETEPLIVPYHWLTLSCLFGRGVNVNVLTPPVFINPKNKQPLRAWVSVNLPKMSGEKEAADAQAAVVEVLIRGGAIVVKKRNMADLLVVDPNSAFCTTAMEEKIRYKRDHQLLKERDWVEFSARDGKIKWDPESVARGEEPDDIRDDTVDAIGKDDMAEKKAPARAARQLYTPADDEFMARFLAAFYPHGAWSSRKTYSDLFDRSGTWPIASNHPPESWHGRFKKDSVYFTKRIQQYIAGGIDDSLKTVAERETEEAVRQMELAPEVPASQVASTSTMGRQTMRRTKPPSEERSPTNRKKALVGSDTESDPDTGVVNPAPSPPATGPAPTDQTTHAANPTINDATHNFPRPKAPTSALPSAAAGPSNTRQELQGDSVMVDESLQVDGNDLNALSQAIIASQVGNLAGAETQAVLGDFDQIEAEVQARKRRAESEENARLRDEMEAMFAAEEEDRTEMFVPDFGAETQAVLGEFDQIQADVIKKREEARRQEEADTATRAVEVVPVEPIPVPRAVSMPRSPPRQASPSAAKRPRHTEPVHRVEHEEMPAPHSTNRHARVSYAGEENGRQRVSIPVRVKVNVVGVTQGSSTEEEGDVHGRPDKRHQRDSSGVHTPGPQHPLLREQQPTSSIGTPSRRKSRYSHQRNHSPDKVYASPAIPAAAPRPPPPDSPSSTTGRRSPSPPLRDNQRNQLILEGQRVAKQQTEQHRAELKRLCEKYGTTLGDLINVIDSTRGPTERALKMEEIGRRLDIYFAQRG